MEDKDDAVANRNKTGDLIKKQSLFDKIKYSRYKYVLPAIILVVLVVIIIVIMKVVHREKYDDDYFVTDDSKLVVAMDKEIASYQEGEYEPDITYVLYYYNNDTINGMKVFFAYDDEEQATEADNNIPLDEKYWATNKRQSGKYLVFDVASDQYEGLTVSYVRKIMSDMEMAGTMYEPEKEVQDEVIDIVDGDVQVVEVVETTE